MLKSGGRSRIYSTDSERVAASVARSGKKAATYYLPPDILQILDGFMLARDETKSQVVERALRAFFRKR